MPQKTQTMKPALALVENCASSMKPNLQSSALKPKNAENNKSDPGLSTDDRLSDKIVGHIWKRMLSIYGHKWASHLGMASNDTGLLSDAARTWQQGLAGVTLEQIKNGFDTLIFKNHVWPPSLPEFRKLCQQNAISDTPSLDEIIAILVTVRNRYGSLAERYTHPLALAISQHGLVDMHNLRTAKTVDAKRMVKPVYEQLLDMGWPGWPDHAHEEQKAIDHDKPRPSKAGALSYLSSIKSGLH